MLWLRIARLCKEFSVLPNSGGLFQQPKGAVLRLEAALNSSVRFEEVEMERNKH